MTGTRKERRVDFLARKYGPVCHLCSNPFSQKPGEEMTIDHVIPLARGGTDHVNNLRLAHKKCNNKRGILPIHLFQQWRALRKYTSLKKFLTKQGYSYNVEKHEWLPKN